MDNPNTLTALLGGASSCTSEAPRVMNILIRESLAYLIMTSIQLTHKPSWGGRQNKIKITDNFSTKAFLNYLKRSRPGLLKKSGNYTTF